MTEETTLTDVLERYGAFIDAAEKPLSMSAMLVSLLCEFADSDLIDRAAEINRLLGQAYDRVHALHSALCEPIREEGPDADDDDL